MAIHGIQRAHSRLQYGFLLAPVTITVVCAVGLFKTSSLWEGLFVFVMLLGSLVLLRYLFRRFKQIFFDDSSIYIHSFFGKPEGKIPYHAVIRLEIVFSKSQWPRSATGLHLLSYQTAKNIRKHLFCSSLYPRQIDLLKRQLSPEKIS